MASCGLNKDLFCSLCLDVYSDPVTLTCGHSFCQECIGHLLDTQEREGGYSCPECREEFQERPKLGMNITLHNVVENLLSDRPDEEEAVIFCKYCVDSDVLAVKSCLLCQASLCERHLKVHSKSPDHVLTDPTTNPDLKKHPIHRKISEYSCSGDSSCLCFFCVTGDQEHELLYKVFKAKKNHLKNVLQKTIAESEEVNKEIQSLRECRLKAQKKAAGVTERIIALFKELRRQLDDLERRVLSEVSTQAERVSLSGLIKQLQRKGKLSRKIRHIEELCSKTDPLTVLQEEDTLRDLEEKEEVQRPDGQRHDGGGLNMTGIPNTVYTGLSDIVSNVAGWIHIPEPAEISLDVDTAHNNLHLSKDKKTATWGPYQILLKTPERFECCQVLSRESFSFGRHYWEVEVGRSEEWNVGMCYPSMDRRGDHSLIGDNDKSWSLERWKNHFSAIHDSKETLLLTYTSSQRIRIFLDYEAGQISFYDLCHPIRHLHTFITTFTEPLHAGLGLWDSGYMKVFGRGGEDSILTSETSRGEFAWWKLK